MKIDDTVRITDIVMIFAVAVAPFLAVFVQRQIDVMREKRGQRLWIFRTLMATRASRLSLEHIQALNSIELYFDNPKRDKKILEKWNEYLDHVGQIIKEDDKDYSAKLSVWLDKIDDLMANLLQTMGKSLGYDFDKVKIKRGVYFPKGHGDEQADNYQIRKGVVALLTKKSHLVVKVEQ